MRTRLALGRDCSSSLRRRGWVIGVLLAACSSSGKGGGRGGTAGSNDSGGTTGSGGADAANGAGGAGGAIGSGGATARAADAGQDAAQDPATSDGAAVMTPEQACQAAIRARCQRSAVCGGNPDDWQSCAEISVHCPEFFFNSGSTRTVAGVAACLDEQARQPCTDLELGLYPSCWSLGTRPAGAACAYGSSCASASCSAADATGCGHCLDGPAATGESCATLRCRSADFCHPGTKLCTPSNTVVHAATGEPCDLAASPAVGCAGDSLCLAPDGQTAGTCGPMPILELGQPCFRIRGLCRPPLTCFVLADGIDNPSECRAPSPAPLCGAAPCDATTYCKTVNGKRACVPMATAGERCTGDAGTVTTPCEPGTLCLGPQGVCTKYGNRGDPCSPDTQPCQSYLVCNNGRCALAAEACL